MSDDNLFQPPDHTLYPRYTGIPTFMRVPYVQDVTQLDIAMVGVPFDSAVPTALARATAPAKCAINRA